MTRQEMIDEAVRRVLRPGRLVCSGRWFVGRSNSWEEMTVAIIRATVILEFYKIVEQQRRAA